jgi:hypothetical protein
MTFTINHIDLNQTDIEELITYFNRKDNSMKILTDILQKNLEQDICPKIKKLAKHLRPKGTFDIKFSEKEWGKIMVPTCFIANLEMYHSIIVILTANSDATISFKKGEVIDLPKNRIYVFLEVEDHSFTLSPVDGKTLYYILFLAPRC